MVLNEYAVVFYMLVKEALILDGIEYSILGNIAIMPNMKQRDINKLMNYFKTMGQNKTTNIEEDRKRLKNILKGKALVV